MLNFNKLFFIILFLFFINPIKVNAEYYESIEMLEPFGYWINFFWVFSWWLLVFLLISLLYLIFKQK